MATVNQSQISSPMVCRTLRFTDAILTSASGDRQQLAGDNVHRRLQRTVRDRRNTRAFWPDVSSDRIIIDDVSQHE
jgi:hypothetical protein